MPRSNWLVKRISDRAWRLKARSETMKLVSQVKQRHDVYTEVTERIVSAIEIGEASPSKWICPWSTVGGARNLDGREYRGINALLLGLSGFSSPVFGTFKALTAAGVQVSKGAKGTRVIYYLFGKETDDATEKGKFRGVKTYAVFNLSQTDADAATRADLEAAAGVKPLRTAVEKDARVLEILDKLKLRGGVNNASPFAAYHPAADAISLPSASSFFSDEDWASTAAHEAMHATGASHRLDRDLSGRFGDASYAMEELVAELGAAMTLSAAGIQAVTREDHAHYLSAWLQRLKADSRPIFACASKAQQGADFLLSA